MRLIEADLSSINSLAVDTKNLVHSSHPAAVRQDHHRQPGVVLVVRFLGRDF